MDCQIGLATWRVARMESPSRKQIGWTSRQHHRQDNPIITPATAAATTTKLYVNRNSSDSSKPGCGCNSLIINNIQTERHLFVVGRQLMQLVEPQPLLHLVASRKHCHHKQAEAGCARIKAIMRIYLRLLNAGPLELRLQSSCPQVLQLRQQVLSYIEALPGYCDSINSLRLILKSPKMINAMQAYQQIVTQLEEQERKLTSTINLQGSRELSV